MHLAGGNKSVCLERFSLLLTYKAFRIRISGSCTTVEGCLRQMRLVRSGRAEAACGEFLFRIRCMVSKGFLGIPPPCSVSHVMGVSHRQCSP